MKAKITLDRDGIDIPVIVTGEYYQGSPGMSDKLGQPLEPGERDTFEEIQAIVTDNIFDCDENGDLTGVILYRKGSKITLTDTEDVAAEVALFKEMMEA